jgi:Fe-Mn family superoxide dismutase
LTRSTYSLPTLANHDHVHKDGIKGLFSPFGFRTAYTDYQQHIIDELNESTAGMPPLPAGHQHVCSRH